MKAAVREQVNGLDGVAYFTLLADLMKTNPPTAADAPMVAKLAKIGLVPGRDFDPTKLDPAVVKGLEGAVKPAQQKIQGWFKEGIAAGDNQLINGWLFSTKTGLYGVNYVQRAMITAFGLGANRPQDAVYPTSEEDSEGRPYSGANKYVLHFPKDEMPPANAFWSLTMYDAGFFFVANPLNRYTVSSRSDFNVNPDGSVDVYIQNASPGKGKEANWLPAPKGKFVLMLRLYWPSEAPRSIIDGSWKIPAVKRAN